MYTGLAFFQDVRQSQQAQFLSERNEDEMDLSDTETEDKEPLAKKRKAVFDGVGKSGWSYTLRTGQFFFFFSLTLLCSGIVQGARLACW